MQASAADRFWPIPANQPHSSDGRNRCNPSSNIVYVFT
jgi:hypothetical protein